jgi:hypothetical protein
MGWLMDEKLAGPPLNGALVKTLRRDGVEAEGFAR